MSHIRLAFFMSPSAPQFIIQKLEDKSLLPYDLLLLADPSEILVNQYLKNAETFIALVENKIEAVLVLYPWNYNNIEIKNIAVQPNLQGKGIGTQLLKFAIHFAKKNGYENIFIGTANSSISQLHLYQKLGFEIHDIKHNFFLENYPEYMEENGIQIKHMIMLKQSLK